MKRAILVTLAGLSAAGIGYCYRVLRKRSRLQQPLQRAATDAVTRPSDHRIPLGQKPMTLDTPLGEVKLVPARGYYERTAIFVFYPDGYGFSEPIANAFREETKGRFIMNRSPGTSNGGNSAADAIISAGLDYAAYNAGKQGYFKCSPAPNMEEVAGILSRIWEAVPAS